MTTLGFITLLVDHALFTFFAARPHALAVLHSLMKKGIFVKQKTRGRPATGQKPLVGFRASPEMRIEIEKWAARQPDKPTLSKAIRRLVELGLKH